MELSRSEYPAMLAALQPTPAVTVMKDRLRKAQTVNAELADWIQERRRVEDQYAQALNKLARKHIPQDISDLGVFQTAWSKLVNSTAELAQAHSRLANKLDTDVERRLRDFTTGNKEWAELKKVEGALSTLANDIDVAERKSDKLKKRGTKAQAAKVAGAATELEKVMSDWESQAPFAFEQFQACDEVRVGNLRDALTQYHTLEADCAQKAMAVAQESLTTLLDINTSDEIKAFASRTTNGKARIERTRSRAGTSHSNTPGLQSSNPSFVMDHDSASVQSSGSGGQHPEERTPPVRSDTNSSLKHGFNLKRLGTVIRGRTNRNSHMPYLRASSPDKRAVSSERLGTPKGPHPTQDGNSVNNSPRAVSRGNESVRRDSVPSMPALVPLAPERVGGSTDGPAQNGDTSRKGSNASNVPPSPSIGGDAPHPPSTAVSMASTANNEPQKDSEGYTIPPPTNNDIVSLAFNGGEEQEEHSQPQFKVEIRNDVIHEEEEDADAAFSKVANSLRQQTTGTVSRKSRGRREAKDVRQTVFFPAAPVMPEHPRTTATPSPTLLPAAPVPGFVTDPAITMMAPPPPTTGALEPSPILYPTAPSQELVGSLMGTTSSQQDLTVEQPTPVSVAPPPSTSTPPPPTVPSSFTTTSPPLSPIRMNKHSFTPSDAGSETQSIRSARSITSLAGAHPTIRHPELHHPGLSASLIQTLSITLEKGQANRAVVSGEVAFSYNPPSSETDIPPPTPTSQLIRLSNFATLERVAPNPSLLTTTAQPGEYTLNLLALAQARTTLAFRFQLALPSTPPPSLAPVLITPAWKIEADKASLILSYRLNPACTLKRPIVLKNVIFVTGVEGPKCSGCQSKPVGTFSREKGRLAWKMPELVLDEEDTAPKKLLARFVTDGMARCAPVEMRWEVEGGWERLVLGEGEENTEEMGALGVEVFENEESEKKKTEGEQEEEADPFADEVAEVSTPKGNWKEVETVRKVLSGKYIAM